MTNGNPFYVKPGGNLLPGLTALSQTAQQYGTNRKEEEMRQKFETIKQGAVDAYQTGDPDVIAEYSLQNPEIAQMLTLLDKNRSQRTKENEFETAVNILANPEGAQKYVDKRVKLLEKEGVMPGDMQETLSFMERYNQDPARAIKELEFKTAAKFPDKWKSFKELQKEKSGTDAPKQKTGAFYVKDQETGETSVAIGVFDPNTGKLTTEKGEIDGHDIVSAIGETARERQAREIETAEGKARVTGEEKRASDLIERGILAAESTATIRRAIGLLDTVKTGGLSAVKYAAKRAFGVEGADEGELSNSLGKAVLSQLRETFGAQFTESEGKRLERIEASFTKSPEANKRLLQQVLRIAERTAKRAKKAAEKRGDKDTIADIDDLLTFSLELPTEPTEIKTNDLVKDIAQRLLEGE